MQAYPRGWYKAEAIKWVHAARSWRAIGRLTPFAHGAYHRCLALAASYRRAMPSK